LPSTVRIVDSKFYQQGKIFGIDLSSIAVIWALGPLKNEKILDLCCCPGAKLNYISDLLQGTGRVVGVDISEERIRVCKKMIEKYNLMANI
jgi:16S rRNA C967 or C1407 C5-methylase (RsmB/RsmF family)